MKVSNLKPFSIVYALYEHQFLGFLFQAFAVQADDKGRLTLQHQNISRKNADEFSACLDKNDMRLISLMDEIQQEAVVKRFSPKKTTSAEFFF